MPDFVSSRPQADARHSIVIPVPQFQKIGVYLTEGLGSPGIPVQILVRLLLLNWAIQDEANL